MSEKRFLNCILIEGSLLIILSLCILILPKLTLLSYGVMLSAAFMTYGLYRIVHSIMNRNTGNNIILSIALGVFLFTIGLLILFVPKISLLWMIALTGIYFVIESISSAVFAAQLRNRYVLIGSKVFAVITLFIAGLLIILGIPVMSFWMVTVICGVTFLIKGYSKTILAIANLNNYNL